MMVTEVPSGAEISCVHSKANAQQKLIHTSQAASSEGVKEYYWGSPGGASGKEPACQCRRHKRHGFDPWVGKIPLEEGMATHSSVLAWRMPWIEEPGRPQSIGSHAVGYDWSDEAQHKEYYYSFCTNETIEEGLSSTHSIFQTSLHHFTL